MHAFSGSNLRVSTTTIRHGGTRIALASLHSTEWLGIEYLSFRCIDKQPQRLRASIPQEAGFPLRAKRSWDVLSRLPLRIIGLYTMLCRGQIPSDRCQSLRRSSRQAAKLSRCRLRPRASDSSDRGEYPHLKYDPEWVIMHGCTPSADDEGMIIDVIQMATASRPAGVTHQQCRIRFEPVENRPIVCAANKLRCRQWSFRDEVISIGSYQ